MPVSTTVAAAVEQLPGLGALREVPEAGGSGAYFSGLKRSDLQALAKKYGIKANIKSADIVIQLLQKGETEVMPTPTGEISTPASGEGGGGEGVQVEEAARAKPRGEGDFAVGQRAVFLKMMVERVWEFRRAQNVVDLLPLLDAGAQVTCTHTHTHTHTH
jgi:hypothetical protein